MAGVSTGTLAAMMVRLDRRVGELRPGLSLRVGAVSDRKQLEWLEQPLAVGDEVSVRVCESDEVDPPREFKGPDIGEGTSTLELARQTYSVFKQQVRALEAKWGPGLHTGESSDA
jgi:hypothetical protein